MSENLEKAKKELPDVVSEILASKNNRKLAIVIGIDGEHFVGSLYADNVTLEDLFNAILNFLDNGLRDGWCTRKSLALLSIGLITLMRQVPYGE